MVLIEAIDDTPPVWQERLLDAEEIERAATKMSRPTARMQLESVAKRLRKESDALKRVEKSKAQCNDDSGSSTTKQASQSPSTASPAAAAATAGPPVVSSTAKFVSIDRFAFDAGGYNSAFVTLYIDLPKIGSIPREQIVCNFTKSSFDLVVKDLDGKSYRLFKDNLEKEIDTDKSKIVVKSDKILVKLAKVKQSDYGGYDHWSKLTDNKKSGKEASKKDDPQQSIMGLMKQMYDDGDDNMKKMIGETMMKQRNGELGKDDPMGGLDDM